MAPEAPRQSVLQEEREKGQDSDVLSHPVPLLSFLPWAAALPPATLGMAYPGSQSTEFCVRALALLHGTQGRRGCHEPHAKLEGPGEIVPPWSSICCSAPHCTTLRALIEEHFPPSTQELSSHHFQLEHTQSFCPPPQREGTVRRNSEKSGSMPLDKSGNKACLGQIQDDLTRP